MDGTSSATVYLSYAQPDAADVERLARVLSDVGLRVWFDRWELAPGQPWKAAVAQARRNAAVTLVCIGPAGAHDPQLDDLQEPPGEEAPGRPRHPVVPVLLPGSDPQTLPPALRAHGWRDLRRGLDNPTQVARIVADLHRAGGPDAGAAADRAVEDSHAGPLVHEGGRHVSGTRSRRTRPHGVHAVTRHRRTARRRRARPRRLPARPVSGYSKMGDLYRRPRPGEQARDAYLQALAIAERLAEAEPDRADYQRDLSVAFNNMGDLYRALGQRRSTRAGIHEGPRHS